MGFARRVKNETAETNDGCEAFPKAVSRNQSTAITRTAWPICYCHNDDYKLLSRPTSQCPTLIEVTRVHYTCKAHPDPLIFNPML